MKLVKARPEDAIVLTSIAVAAKRHWGYPDSWISQWMESLTVTPDYIETSPTFVASIEDTIVGFYSLRFQTTVVQLEHLWVLPAAMRRGVGRALFEHAESTARAAGAVRLKIDSDPHAEGFYRRMGATRYGERAASMDEEERFLPLLEKSL